jgi:hypothetical protein
MNSKSSWASRLSAAAFGAMLFVPALADAQIRPPSTRTTDRVEQQRARDRVLEQQRERDRSQQSARDIIFGRSTVDDDRDSDSDGRRSCKSGSKSEKKHCKELRKEEKRHAKAHKQAAQRRHACERSNNQASFCRNEDGTLRDVILGRDGSSTASRRKSGRPGVHLPGGGF